MNQIKSFVRIRPSSEPDQALSKLNDHALLLNKSQDPFLFQFVFDQHSSNRQVFDRVCPDLIEQSLGGKNVCVLAYGQTSTGKSHTILGDQSNPGLIPLCIRSYFQLDKERKLVFQMKVSYIQIYLENIRDLLSGRKGDFVGGKLLGIEERNVLTVQDALTAFYQGERNRKISKTNVNQQSSRSHAVFKISLQIRSLVNQSYRRKVEVSLADLAGSQAVSKTGAQGLIKKQGESINKSLLALSNVVRQLSQRAGFVNFRDSKLTKILKSTLTGGSLTSIICTVSPLANNLSETSNTLKFGVNACAIKSYSSQAHDQDSFQQIKSEGAEQNSNNNSLSLEMLCKHEQMSQAFDIAKRQLSQTIEAQQMLKDQNERLHNKIRKLEIKISGLQETNLIYERRLKATPVQPLPLPLLKINENSANQQNAKELRLQNSKLQKKLILLETRVVELESQLSLQRKQAQKEQPAKAQTLRKAIVPQEIDIFKLGEEELLKLELHKLRKKLLETALRNDQLEEEICSLKSQGGGKRRGGEQLLRKRLQQMRQLIQQQLVKLVN